MSTSSFLYCLGLLVLLVGGLVLGACAISVGAWYHAAGSLVYVLIIIDQLFGVADRSPL